MSNWRRSLGWQVAELGFESCRLSAEPAFPPTSLSGEGEEGLPSPTLAALVSP